MPNRYNTTIRNARLQAVVTEAGSGALIEGYDGAQPATLGGAAAGTLLIEAVGAATLGTVSSGVLTFNAITGDASANASGTPTWFRIKKSGGAVVADVLATGASAAVAGQAYGFSSFTLTEGNA